MALNKFGPQVDGRFSPEIGQYFYMVDSNYRTAAQGWSRPDGTGPLDLWNARQPGGSNETRVFYTPEAGIQGTTYATQAAAAQAAIDAMVDFRGDTLFWTPGSYTISTALSIDVPDAHWIGPKVSLPKLAQASLVAGVASAFTMTAAADRMELGWLRLVPLTAATMFSMPANTDGGHFHDFYYDTNGIAASTATILATFAGTTNDNWTFSNFQALTDAAQGPMLSVVGTYRDLVISDFEWVHEAGTLAACLILENSAGDAAGPGPITVRNGKGYIAGGGAVTNLIELTDAGIDTAWVSIENFRGVIGFCAAGALIDLAGGTGNTAEAAETNLRDNTLFVVGAGAGGVGTVYTQ